MAMDDDCAKTSRGDGGRSVLGVVRVFG